MLDDLSKLERKIFQTFWDDGLIDLFAGVGVLLIGLAWWRALPVMGAIVPALMIPLWKPLRDRWIEPRLGLVEFSETRMRTNRRWMNGSVVGGVVVLLLALAVYFTKGRAAPHELSHMIAALPAALLAVMATLVAVMLSCVRFLVYALVLLGASAVGLVLKWEPGSILVLAGGIITLMSLFVLLRFLGEYPSEDELSE